MALAVWTNDQILAQLNSGARWSGSVITYSFATSVSQIYAAGGETSTFSAFNAQQQAAATLALSLWDDLISPSMQKVAPGTSYTSSNIEFANMAVAGSYAYAYFPTVGSVWFNSTYDASWGTNDLVTPKIGQHGFISYIHEIGHSLGLEHMGNYNGSATSGPSSFQDSTVYSVMSYYGPDWNDGAGQVAWADWTGADGRTYSPQTQMLNDIMALQAMYGADLTTRAGDTTYGFNSTITGAQAQIYDFAVNKNPILCLWDGGGNDTLDLSGWSTASRIDLRPGSFSDGNSMTSNISIAYNCIIENAIGGAGNDQITGNVANNRLDGGAGNDTLNGLEGNDTLIGGAGNDIIDGGIGTDIVIFGQAWSAITYTYEVATANFTFAGQAIGTDTVRNVESFMDSFSVVRTLADLLNQPPPPPAPVVLPSTVSVTALQTSVTEGNSGTTSVSFRIALDAAAASDQSVNWAVAGTGASAASASDFSGALSGSLVFAAGETVKTVSVSVVGDLLVEANETFALTLSAASAGLTLGTSSATVSILNDDFSTVFNGTALADRLTGTAGDDQLYGLAGNDVLTGNAGNDLLDGGTGSDSMAGGTGNDIYVVDSTGDIVSEGLNAGIDLVRTTLSSFTLGANVENLTYIGSGNFVGNGNTLANVITGGAGNDSLFGNAGNDTLIGGGGNDVLNGGTGADTMSGGSGNDTYYVDNSGDTIYELSNDGIDTMVTVLTTATLAANVENLTYSGSSTFTGYGNALDNILTGGAGANTLFGLDGNDTLFGNGGNDVLIGGLGDDKLYGGANNDTLTGGAGADSFYFNTALGRGNVDVITDFDTQQDHIYLENTGIFSSLITTGTLAAGAFNVGTRAMEADDRIFYNATTGGLYYDADGSGRGAAIQFATLSAGLHLTNENFVVY